MALVDPGRASRDTGLPPGVEVGPLGKRVVAYLIEALVPATVSLVLPGAADVTAGSAAILSIVAALVIVGWPAGLVPAGRAGGRPACGDAPAAGRLLRGRPIGWLRVLLRALIFWVLSAPASD